MIDEDKLNDLHLEDAMSPENLIDILLKIINTHPTLSLLFFYCIMYLILNGTNPFKIEK